MWDGCRRTGSEDNMILETYEDSNIEVVFSYLPAWEMFFSMHVLSDWDHHMYRKRWARRIYEKEPELVEQIIGLGRDTGFWTFVIDAPQWSRIRQMEIAEMISFLQKKNICQWNEMTAYTGRKMDITTRNAVLRTIKEYHECIFEREERVLRPYLTRILLKEKERCREVGIWRWCGEIHPRLLVEEDRMIYQKNREYCYERSGIRRIFAMVSSFVNPHLWLYKGDGELEMVKAVLTEHAQEGIPKRYVLIFKALGDQTRLRIVKLLIQGTLTTQELAGKMGISEAGVSRHLRILNQAGLVSKSMKGHYVEYNFLTEMIDFIPYTFYETMML